MTDSRLEIVLAAKDITGKAFDNVQASIAGLGKSLFSVNGMIAGFTGAAGLGLVAKQSMDAVAEIDRLSTIAGVGAEAFQELSYAAGQYQITQDALTDGLKELSLRGDEFAVTGAGSAQESFERLGYTAKDVNSLLGDTPAFLSDIISRMETLDKASQIRIADELFGGTGGEQFVSMIQGGAKALDGMRQSAHDLGVVIDDDMVKQSVEAKKQVENLTTVLSANFTGVVAEISPHIINVSTGTLDWVKANKDLIGQGVDVFVNEVGDAFDFVSNAVTRTTEAVDKLVATYNKFPDSLLTRFFKSQIAEGQSYVDFLNSDQGLGYVDSWLKKAQGQPKHAKSLQSSSAMQREVNDLVDANLAGWFNDVDIAAEKYIDMFKEGAQVTLDMRTPTEQLADETERLNDLLSAGAINAETFGRAMANAQEDIKGSAVDADLEAFFSEIDRKSDELAKKTTTDWDNAFAGWANSYSSTLNDMLWGSETTFEGIATSFGKMITEMIIQQELIKPFVSGATGDDGWISQGFGAITNWIASEHGNVFASNQCGISAYSNQIVSSPTVFPFASGIGLMGEAGAEAIFPLTRMPTGNLGVEAKLNGGSSINVVNNITVESSGNADDDQELARNIATQIDVAVRRIIADEKRHGGLIA
jgi:hypothetical protein